MTNSCQFVQKINVKDSFDLSKLTQTLHAYFKEHKGEYFLGLEPNKEKFDIFVFSSSLENLQDICDYVEQNRYLKRQVSFDRSRSVPEETPLVEYSRMRIKTSSRIESEVKNIRETSGDKAAELHKSKYGKKLKRMFKMRHINMKSSETGHKFVIVLDKKQTKETKAGGSPDSYGFSGTNHTALVPDPSKI